MYNYFIVHNGTNDYYITINDIKTDSIFGQIGILPEVHKKYFHDDLKQNKPYRYKSKDDMILNEVIIYASNISIKSNSQIAIPLNAIDKIEIIDKDSGTTTASWVLGGIGVTVAVLGIIAIIVALTKESCPYIYSSNGDHFVLEGESFGGAIYPSMERDDYMPLSKISPFDGKYLTKISNELKERQFTNLAELIVTNHPEHTAVLTDKTGKIFTLGNIQLPASAISNTGNSYKKELNERDNNFYLFNDYSAESDFNSIILKFKKPAENKSADTAKLLLNAKNSFWLDYIYQEFSSMFGNKYERFTEHRNQMPPEDNLRWGIFFSYAIRSYGEKHFAMFDLGNKVDS